MVLNLGTPQDYYDAMGRIEQRLELVGRPADIPEPVSESELGQLKTLAEQLFASELGYEKRIEIVAQMCGLVSEVIRQPFKPLKNRTFVL